MKKLIKEIATILESDTKEIDENTVLSEHPLWDSLASISTIAMLLDEFKVNINEEELMTCRTVNDLYKFISDKIN